MTFPRSPLCLDRMPPPFFTATSRVLLWSSTTETLNSNLHIRCSFLVNSHSFTAWRSKTVNLRLIVDGVKGLLGRGRLSPARAALVRQQIETYEGI